LVKRGIVSTFRDVAQKHFNRYPNEFDFRCNSREDLSEGPQGGAGVNAHLVLAFKQYPGALKRLSRCRNSMPKYSRITAIALLLFTGTTFAQSDLNKDAIHKMAKADSHNFTSMIQTGRSHIQMPIPQALHKRRPTMREMRLARASTRFMAKLSVLFACLLVLTVSTKAEGPPTGFRRFKWGSPPTAALKKIMGPTHGVTMYVRFDAKNLAPLFKIPVAEEDYSFSHNKFFQGDAYLDGELNFPRMKAVLIAKFGNPSFVNEALSVWKWRWPVGGVEVHLTYEEKFARSTVTFVDNNI
jgi:hypothetical protein